LSCAGDGRPRSNSSRGRSPSGVYHLIRAELPHRPAWTIRVAMQMHTRSRSYLLAVIEEGSARVNLDGTEAQPITDAEREHAIKRLDWKFPGWRGDQSR
jgi:hypothetical protein